MGKTIINKIIITFIILFSLFGIFYHQNNFDKVYETDKDYIIDMNLGNFNTLEYKLSSIVGEGLIYTLKLQELAIEIDNSISYGKNKWVGNSENFTYIENFLNINKEKGEIYNMVFDKIIKDNYIVHKSNINKYKDLLNKYLLIDTQENIKEENLIKAENYSKEYNEIYKYITNKFCKNKIYPLKQEFNEYYLKQVLYNINNDNLEDALCFNITSGYDNTLAGWQTLTFSILGKISEDKIKTKKDFIEMKTDINNIYYLIINKIVNKKVKDFHRNSNDIIEVKKVNDKYKQLINKINYFIIKNNI